MRRRAKPAKAEVEAKPLAHKSLKSEGSRVRDPEKRLAESLEREKATSRALSEALEQQTATSEILRVISRSPSDYQPVFDSIVHNAGRVCAARDAVVFLIEDGEFVLRAHHGELEALIGFHQPLQGTAAGLAVSEARRRKAPCFSIMMTLDGKWGLPGGFLDRDETVAGKVCASTGIWRGRTSSSSAGTAKAVASGWIRLLPSWCA